QSAQLMAADFQQKREMREAWKLGLHEGGRGEQGGNACGPQAASLLQGGKGAVNLKERSVGGQGVGIRQAGSSLVRWWGAIGCARAAGAQRVKREEVPPDDLWNLRLSFAL